MTIAIKGEQLIAGESSRDGQITFSSVNPQTKTPLSWSFADATLDEIDRAVNVASSAFEETRDYPADRLAEFLDRVAVEIDALGGQLLEVAQAETALGKTRLSGERQRTTGQLRKFAALLREGSYVEAIINTAQPERQPTPGPFIGRMLYPLGPVAVFSASNFPFAFAVAGGDTASAFAAGCPVIVKGHPSHPATSELFGRAINQAIGALDFPAGFFSLLQGRSVEVGQSLVTHPGVTAVGFTGSLGAGRAIYNAAAARPNPIPVYAEMGSVNPVVILPGALQERAEAIAVGLVSSLTLGAGQFCTNPGLIFVVDGPQSRQFLEDVSQRLKDQEAGTLLNQAIESGLAEAVSQTQELPSIQLLTGGQVIAGESYCYANTVLQSTSAAFRANPDLQREHFGPVTLFVKCQSLADLLETMAFLHGHLTATVHADQNEGQVAGQLFQRLRDKAGRLIYNGFPTGVEVVYAMHHGGPYPATTASATTSVGMAAIKRFMRPVAFQDVPDALLPSALQAANPLGIWRIIDDHWTQNPFVRNEHPDIV